MEVEFNLKTGSDMIWISPELDLAGWRHPEGKPMWDCFANVRESLGSTGIFAECEDVAEVEAFDWPNADYLDFSGSLSQLQYAHEKGLGIFGGMWCPFFHVVCDFFGMENYFVKMYTDPDVVHAVTSHVVDFFVETNTRFFALAKNYLDAGFFGNDFGTPEQVREEVLRLRDIFGDNYIVSPSHEALLPDVPVENVMAMSGAAKE